MKYIVILFTLLLSLNSMASTAMWVWSHESYEKGSVIFDSNEQQTLLEICKKFSINTIFLDVQQIVKDPKNTNALNDFLILMQENDIQIEPVLAKHDWILENGFEDFQKRLHQLFYILEALDPAIRPKTIHLDIEPQALAEWETDRQSTIAKYFDLIKLASYLIHSKDYQLSIDAGFYYDQFEVDEVPLDQALMSLVDNYIIMSYRDYLEGPGGILDLVKEELSRNCDTQKYASLETNPHSIDYVTLAGQMEKFREILNRLQEHPILKTAIHDYMGLKKLIQHI
jgi:hypothetical protein